ncbi:MAG: hypothetical protein ACJ74Y_00500 [Bryobacteraceae bacterium]
MNCSEAIVVSHQQFGDDECAEQKKDRNAEVAEKADVVELVVLCLMDRYMIHTMHGKHAYKREQAQEVQFGVIIAADICFIYSFSELKSSMLGIRANIRPITELAIDGRVIDSGCCPVGRQHRFCEDGGMKTVLKLIKGAGEWPPDL